MVYTIFLGKQGKRVYTIGPERRVYTIEPQTRKKKKRWVSTVVVYAFFSPVNVPGHKDKLMYPTHPHVTSIPSPGNIIWRIVWPSFGCFRAQKGKKRWANDCQMICQMNSGGGEEWKWRGGGVWLCAMNICRNQRGNENRVFRVRFRAPFSHPFSSFSPLFPLQALFTFLPLHLPFVPPFLTPGKLRDLGAPLI